MSTFLELAQKVAEKSGTVTDGQPTTVEDLTGRLKKVVDMTAEAWRDIQRSRNEWLWMRMDFSGNTSSGIAEYAPASFAVSDLARWVSGNNAIYLSDTSIGFEDEGPLRMIDWDVFVRRYKRGTHDNSRPTEYAIAPNRRINFGPTPDKDYTIRGEYYKTIQTLAVSADIPEMPEDFHDLIVWRALILLTGHDEAVWHHSDVGVEFLIGLSRLEQDQLPEVRLSYSALA